MPQAIFSAPGEGATVSFRGTNLTFKVRGDQAATASWVEFEAAPGFDTGLHVHHNLEETYYVLEGEFELRAGDHTRNGGPGTVMLVPPGVPHSFANRTDASAKVLLLMTPPAHDQYFVELADILAASGPPDSEAIASLRNKYDTHQISSLLASDPSIAK
jgi:quercetin dioxygenase-like cupin family protein